MNRSRGIGIAFLVPIVVSAVVLGQDLQEGHWHRAFVRRGTLSTGHFWSLQVPAGKIRVQIVADRTIAATLVSFTDEEFKANCASLDSQTCEAFAAYEIANTTCGEVRGQHVLRECEFPQKAVVFVWQPPSSFDTREFAAGLNQGFYLGSTVQKGKNAQSVRMNVTVSTWQ